MLTTIGILAADAAEKTLSELILGLACLACLVVPSGWSIYLSFSEQLKEKEKAREADRARVVSANDAIRRFTNHFNVDCIVIDSNIWMKKEYQGLFECLHSLFAHQKRVLVLSATQFDEICNLKKKAEFGDESSKRARLAIERIEWFQSAGLLHIESVTIDASKGAYADPQIVKLLVAAAEEQRTIRLLSDDKELRVRVREHLRAFPNSQSLILDSDELVVLSREIKQAIATGIVNW